MKPWIPYVAPYATFVLLTAAAAAFQPWGPLVAYPLKLALCAAMLWTFARRGCYPELRAPYVWRLLPLDLAVGALVFVVWIAPESVAWLKFGESRFDPEAAGRAWYFPLVAVRLVGAVVLVPVMEELFIRSFLPRLLEAPDAWREHPVARFGPGTFAIVAVLFGLAHHRWAVGIAAGVVYNAYLLRRRSLLPVIVAHAATNLALGIYVLQTRQWGFW